MLGSAAAAQNLGVSPLVIGLTVVGFGTSAPEFLVSAIAAGTGSAPLCVGNALGSNITNVALVLGAAALVAPMNVEGTVLKRELPILLLCMVVAAGLMADGFLGVMDGAILAAGLVVMMGWVVWLGLRSEGGPGAMDGDLPDPMSNGKALLWIVIGLVVLLASSRLLVWGAVEIARNAGVSELVIGLSVVAFGTSLPELAASVIAAHRGEHELAVGNVIGSNMFNTLGVLALPGLIAPSPVDRWVLIRDLPAMFIVTLLFFVMTRFFRKQSRVSRPEGVVLLLAFAVYIGVLFYTAAFVGPPTAVDGAVI